METEITTFEPEVFRRMREEEESMEQDELCNEMLVFSEADEEKAEGQAGKMKSKSLSDEGSELRVGSNRDHFNRLKEVCDGDAEFAAKMFSAGKTVTEAEKLFSLEQIEKENRGLKLQKRFLTERDGELREELLKFSGGDESRAFRAFKVLVRHEKI